MKTLVAISLLFLSCLGLAQTTPVNWSGSVFYNVNLHHFDAVVFNRIGDLTIKGKSVGVEADFMLGAANAKNTPAVFGVCILIHRKLFDQIEITAGVGGVLTSGKFGGGPTLGIRVNF